MTSKQKTRDAHRGNRDQCDHRDHRLAATWGYGILLAAVLMYFTLPVLIRWWTRPPAVQMENLDCLRLLRTAVSSRNPQHISGVKRLLEKRSNDALMSPTEKSHFDRIVRIAESNDWEKADFMCVRFEEAQQYRH